MGQNPPEEERELKRQGCDIQNITIPFVGAKNSIGAVSAPGAFVLA